MEELIHKGKSIEILSESDFIELCNNENKNRQLEYHEPKKVSVKPKVRKTPNDESVIGLKLDEPILRELNRALENRTDDEKETAKKKNLKYRRFIESFTDCSQKEKRALANLYEEFDNILETIEIDYQIETENETLTSLLDKYCISSLSELKK